ncbi:MAG TPA: ABC transporter ATP-binding protein [Trebonia sp.]|jgi:oligopeptide/dipeptide ABC transporter ATP-binding protein|nr:ABC transporter ATP-binding protein [Trebonia sp.]
MTAATSEGQAPLLEVRDLSVTFASERGTARVVHKLSYSVSPAETLAIIGESGSGKTVSSRAVMGLLPPAARVTGSIRLNGQELVGLPEHQLRRHRGRDVAMVFQDPARSLNPTMKIGQQVTEAIRLQSRVARREAQRQSVELLRQVRLPSPERRFHEYPHQLSGGMRQRVMIAIALAGSPRLLIADEATTALDVTTQAQIMDLLLDLQAQYRMGLVLISHDMGLAASYAQTVMVMYAGQAVERAPTRELFASVRMPYTKVLLEAVPRLDLDPHSPLPVVSLRQPDLTRPAPGCAYAPRCPRRADDCGTRDPVLEEHENRHFWACFHPEEPTTTDEEVAAVPQGEPAAREARQ